MPEWLPWLATFWLHSTVLLAGAALVQQSRVSVGLRDLAWKAAAVAPLFTATAQVLGAPTLGGKIQVLPGQTLTAQAGAVQAAWATTDLALVSWGVCVCLGVLWLLRDWLITRSALAHRQPAPERVQQLAAQMADGLVRVTVSEALGGPVALRKEVCLPPGALALSDPELRAILGHELAHVRRRDPEWMVIFAALVVLFPMQPLLYLARSGHGRNAEPLCDAMAVNAGADPLTLAQTLTTVARWGRGSVGPLAAMAHKPVVGRVHRLVQGRLAQTAPRASAQLVLIAALSLTAWAPRLSHANQVGSLERAQIDDTIRTSLHPIRACYQTALQGSPTLQGEIQVDFLVGSSGSIIDLTIAQGLGHGVDACVAEQLRGLTFPQPAGGGQVRVRYPFRFSPG
jgi:beta-lactamase regulating signal transducer with metallopeptidase domain